MPKTTRPGQSILFAEEILFSLCIQKLNTIDSNDPTTNTRDYTPEVVNHQQPT